jgi:hypothetical protein
MWTRRWRGTDEQQVGSQRQRLWVHDSQAEVLFEDIEVTVAVQ